MPDNFVHNRTKGSSPRVWGQVKYTQTLRLLTRIIPTRMGTSHFIPIFRCVCKDHPHAYGDKHNLISSSLYSVRIIPTRMGTSLYSFFLQAPPEDHPHAYGDKGYKSYLPMIKLGSSPRVWGQVVQVSPDGAKFGIIPTRMGTRLPQYRRWRQ